jgi:hypothetical protein
MSWVITPSNALVDDQDALTYLAAVETADGQALESGVRLAVNAFVKGCKVDGIWPAIKASCVLAGARTLSGALVPLVGTAPTNANFVSGDYNRKTGLIGNASTKYLDSNRDNNADPQNSQHVSVYASNVATSSASEFPAYFGRGGNAESGAVIMGRLASNGDLYQASRIGSLFSGGNATVAGLHALSRNLSASYVRRVAGANTTITDTSQAPFAGNIAIFASNRTAGIQNYSNARLAFYSIGEFLDLAKLDTRVTTLINALAAAIP